MKIRVFISSVQKELADERLALQTLLTTDPFLSLHCVPVLFELHPAPLVPSEQPYLDLLSGCHIYIGVVWKQYGSEINGLSATHREYRYAKENNMYTLIAIKGPAALDREAAVKDFIEEIKQDNHTYDRFKNTEELQLKVRARLIRHIKENYHIEPTADQEQTATETIHAASAFERQRLDRISWEDMDQDIAIQVVAKAEETDVSNVSSESIRKSLWQRGYIWQGENDHYFATAAGILLMAQDPSVVFPHARVQLSVFSGTERTDPARQ